MHDKLSLGGPKVFRRTTTILTAVTAGLLISLTLWGQAAPAQKQWKDRAEYDLFDAIVKAQDPNKRLELLNTWKSKYPQTDFKEQRNAYYIAVYQQLNRGADLLNFCKTEVLSANPQDMTCLYWVSVLTVSMANTAPDALDYGEKCAKAMLANLDAAFAPDKRPKEMTEEQFKRQRLGVEAQGHTTIGWVNMQRKNNEAAEAAFIQSLKAEPNAAQVSYWLGTVILAQRKIEKQAAALYHFARAASLTGQGALPEAQRKQLEAYLTKVYTNYHGDSSGLAEIRAQAAKNPFPPEGFKIESKEEIELKRAEEFRKANPMMALWMTIRKELTGPEGEKYFAEHVKDAELPAGVPEVTKFKGKLVSHKPAANPKELLVAISDATTPEVTLKLETPLKGKAEPGTEIAFAGIATSFTKDPFNLVFETEPSKIEGWPAQAAAPAKKAAPVKKPAAPVKKAAPKK
jgi:hypothetical protein